MIRPRGIVAFVWLLTAAALTAGAAPPAGDASLAAGDAPAPRLDAGRWLWLTSPRFTVVGNVPEPRLRAVADRLEAYREALEALHPGSTSSPRETTVYVFRDAATGRRYAPPLLDAGHLGAQAPYDMPNLVAIAAPIDDPPLEPLYHAYAHQFLDDNFPRLPLTITEGLAEFYSGFQADARSALLGLARGERVDFLKQHESSAPAALFALDETAPSLASPGGRDAFLSGSWLLVHYLVSGSGEKRARLPDFLDALRRGVAPADALRDSYGWSLDDLKDELRGYLLRDHYVPIRVARPAPEAPAVEARLMTSDEMLAVLGDLLAHGGAGRARDAEAHLQDALRLNPRQAKAHAGLGYLYFVQNRPQDAIASLRTANEIAPDGMSCYLLARLLLRSTPGAPAPATLAEARILLGRAIVLRPGFAAPYVLLGATHTYPDGDVDAGIRLLRTAHDMLPARMDIVTNMVYLLLRKGDSVHATQMVEGVLARGGDPEALRSARQSLSAYRDNARARDEARAAASVPPEAKAKSEAWRAEMIRILKKAIAEQPDPEKKAHLEASLRLYEAPDAPSVATTYNQAIELANRRDYAGAISILETLLSSVAADDPMKDDIAAMLARLRQDAEKFKQTVK